MTEPMQTETSAPAANPQAGKSISGSEIWDAAKALRPRFAEASSEIEAARRLPPHVVASMHEHGLFRLIMPKIWGGPELTSLEQVEVIEEVSRGDASVGWCLMIGCDSGLYSGYLDDTVARELYPKLDMVQAGWVFPAGRAHEVDDGYLVQKAQWAFLSGSTHADRIAAGCVVCDADGAPKMGANDQPDTVVVIAPAEEWDIDDNWVTTGLRGTASNDYTIKGETLFVPREHTFSWSRFDERPRREGLLWEKPDTLLRKMAGIPLGVARATIDYAIDVLKDKVEMPSRTPARANRRIQASIAEAEMKLGATRSYVFSSLETQWRRLEAREDLKIKERADVWLSRYHAFQTAREIANLIYDTIGASSIYAERGPLDRACRDTTTMCQHMVGQRKIIEPAGGLLLEDPELQHGMI